MVGFGDPMLHCLNCWWSTPPGKDTHCQRCGHQLHVPDGRSVVDVVNTAAAQAAAYAAAGYHPAYAPAAAEAAAILAAPPATAGPWVKILRLMIVIPAALFTVLLLLGALAFATVSSALPAGLSNAVGTILAVEFAMIVGGSALMYWAVKYWMGRLVILILSGAGLALFLVGIVGGASAGIGSRTIAFVLLEFLYGAAFCAVLVLSIIKSRPQPDGYPLPIPPPAYR